MSNLALTFAESITYPPIQRIIELSAERTMYINLSAERTHVILLRGDVVTTPTEEDFTMAAGEDLILRIPATENGAVLDLSGATIKWALVKNIHATNPPKLLYKESPVDGIEVTDAAAGVFQVTLDRSDTLNLKPGTYYHEAWMVDANGLDSRISAGKVTIEATSIKD